MDLTEDEQRIIRNGILGSWDSVLALSARGCSTISIESAKLSGLGARMKDKDEFRES
jgi:hypothetical protein